jgi:hypothetical protein
MSEAECDYWEYMFSGEMPQDSEPMIKLSDIDRGYEYRVTRYDSLAMFDIYRRRIEQNGTGTRISEQASEQHADDVDPLDRAYANIMKRIGK